MGIVQTLPLVGQTSKVLVGISIILCVFGGIQMVSLRLKRVK